MESRLPKIKSIVKQTANWVIRIVGSLILLFLVWYAMRTLQYMLPVAGHEDLVEIPDSVIRNLAAAALIFIKFCNSISEKRPVTKSLSGAKELP